MEFLDYALMVLYLLVMVAIGFWASKKIKTTDDFALGGRTLTPFVIICSSVATATGAGACLGQAGRGYDEGFSALWLVIAWAIGMFALALMAKKIHRTGAVSISGIFEKYHGKSVGRMCSVYTLVYSIGTLISQIMGMGTVLQLLLNDIGMSYTLAVIIGGTITILYTLQGGFLAVAYTDTIQMIILGVSVAIVFPIVVLSGMAETSLQTIEAVFTPGTFDLFHNTSFMSLLAVICIYTFSACTGIPYIQRVLASRTDKEARTSQIIASFGYLIVGGVVVIAAVLARSIFPEIDDSQTVVVKTIIEHFPTVLAGLGIAGLIAAVMSSVDSYLIVVSQIFTQDIYGWVVKDMTPKKEIKVCRISTVAFGVIALLIALAFNSILVVFEFTTAIYSAAIFFPFILTLYWKKTKPNAIIMGMIAGSLVALFFKVFPMAGIDGVILGNSISLIVTVVASLVLEDAKKLAK